MVRDRIVDHAVSQARPADSLNSKNKLKKRQ
jgi:hypothetical protein